MIVFGVTPFDPRVVALGDFRFIGAQTFISCFYKEAFPLIRYRYLQMIKLPLLFSLAQKGHVLIIAIIQRISITLKEAEEGVLVLHHAVFIFGPGVGHYNVDKDWWHNSTLQ